MDGLIKYTPAIPLSEFIDYLYVDQGSSTPGSYEEYIQPTHPRLVMNADQPAGTPKNEVKGIHTRPLKKAVTGVRGTVGVRFKPYGLYTGFGIPGKVMADNILPGAILLLPSSEARVLEIMRDGHRQELVEYLHEALYNRLTPNPVLYEITNMIDELVKADLANNSQRQLALAFERTPKSFIALFKKVMGITPLNYLHIHKVEEAKKLIRKQPDLSLTDITYILGFYDQAHFTRVFKSHTGLTPSRFKSKSSKTGG